jgi:hypothetical protein
MCACARCGRSTGAAIWKWSHRRPHQSTSDHQHPMMGLPAAQLARSTPALTSTGEKGRQIGGRKWRPGLNAQGAKSRKPPCRSTANTDERTLTAVMTVPHPGLCEKSAASIGSNSSAPSGDFSEIEATIHRLCDARGDDDGNSSRGLLSSAPTLESRGFSNQETTPTQFQPLPRQDLVQNLGY